VKGLNVKHTLALIPAALAAVALAAAPAMAKTKKHHRSHHAYYGERYGAGPLAYGHGPYRSWGWNSRFVSDPSYNSHIRFLQNPYRCTEDLGYGRYEYCGW
jgi:hypothetical protein